MTAEVLLSRLEQVKQTGKDRWLARCPAHPDKHPSLNIRETPDGKVLIKCFTGCGAADVVAAVGLELSDLFPPCFIYTSPSQRDGLLARMPSSALKKNSTNSFQYSTPLILNQ